MSVATLNGAASSSLAAPLKLVPVYFDTDLIVSPPENPVYTPDSVADLVASFESAPGQLVPGYVCTSPELPDDKRYCLEGNRRLMVARILGWKFWAFDVGHDVREEERIRLTFQHHVSRRRMSREEIAERAARYLELTRCTRAVASIHLNISEATLSRAFGDRRIPEAMQARAAPLALYIKSQVAAMPPDLMEQSLSYAATPGPDGRMPTRDLVDAFNRELKMTKSGRAKPSKPTTLALEVNGRVVTFTTTDTDTPKKVSADLKAIEKEIAARFSNNPEATPDRWPELFPLVVK